jgi:hypothetical protein
MEAPQPAVQLIDDIIGVLGGHDLRDFRKQQDERRESRQARLTDRAIEILQSRGVKEPVEPNAAAVDELAEAAQNEPREELRELWARLLAAMFDPARADSVRREFIGIAKQLEPIDAAVLPLLVTAGRLDPNRRDFVATRLSRNRDDVEIAFRNLERLALTWQTPGGGGNPTTQPMVTTLGRMFLAAVE